MPNLLKYARAVLRASLRGGRILLSPYALAPVLFLMGVGAASHSNAQEGTARQNPHNYANKSLCQMCHKAEMPGLNFDPVTTCTKCHSGNVEDHPVTRHPIGKVPRINIPENLPLTGDGRIVCYTCHDPHNRSIHPKMLRVEYLKLCDSCHVGY